MRSHFGRSTYAPHAVRGLTVVNIPSIRQVSSERVSESDKIVDRRA